MARYQERQRAAPTPLLKTKAPTPPSSEPENKKAKWKVEPLSRTTPPLPSLPDQLRQRQDLIDSGRLPGKQSPPSGSPKQRLTNGHSVLTNGATPFKTMDYMEVVPGGRKDPQEILSLVRENPKLGFLYLTPAVEKSSIEYNPYNLT